MRYRQERKGETRERILDAAVPAFRAGGIAETGIGALMGRIGLTHGGFYAHFASKDALVAEACGRGLGETIDRLTAAVGSPAGGARAFIRRYLSRSHRDRPVEGCPIPALAGDIARQPAVVRGAFTDALGGYLERLAAALPARDGDERADDALVLAAGLAGAIMLARAVDDPVLSDRILAASREFYTRAFADGGDGHPDVEGAGVGR